MNWLDIVLLVVIGVMTSRAWRNGFILELVSLGALILAVPIAGVFYDDMFPKVLPIVDNDFMANLISFLAILVGVVVGGQVVAHLLRQSVAMLNLGPLDHFAGAVFGFFKAVVLCQVVLVALVVFPKPNLLNAIDDSSVAGALLDSAPVVLAILPGTFDDGLDLFMSGLDALDGTGGPDATPSPVR